MSHSHYSSQRSHRPRPDSFHAAYNTHPSNYPATQPTREHIAYGQEPPMNISMSAQQIPRSTYGSSYGRPTTSSQAPQGYSTTNCPARPRSSSTCMPQVSTSHYPPSSYSAASNTGYGHVRSNSQVHVPSYSSTRAPETYGAYTSASGHPQTIAFPPPSSPNGDKYQQDNGSGQYPASPQRPFPCDLCALSFNRLHDLRRHKETHSGDRPFECNGGCGKTFTRKDALKRHQVKGCGTSDD